MIKICESRDDLDFMKSDPFAVKITAVYDTYGCCYDFSKTYIQTIADVSTAAISSVEGNVTIYAESSADFEELAQFVHFGGYRYIQSHSDILDKLGLKCTDSSYIVKYSGKKRPEPECFSSEFKPLEIYNLLVECGFEMGDYSSFLADICSRLNRKAASFGCIEAGGVPVSCVFRLFESKTGILLGAVATHPQHRGKGYSSCLLSCMADENKTTYLLTRNDSLLNFYKNNGFVPIGRWASSVIGR